jgi:drug/metabolite transporter (DMT)-like permease
MKTFVPYSAVPQKYIGPVSLLSIGVLFGLSGVITKYLSSWLNPYQVVEYRFLVAFACAVCIAVVTRQKISFHKIDLKTLILFAVTFPISVIFFALAIFNTSVSSAVFSYYIATLVSSFAVGWYYFDEKLTNNKKIALFFILLALLAFTNPFKDFTLQLGFIFGIISGLVQTAASAFQKIVGKNTNRIGLLLIQTLAGVGIAALSLLLSGEALFPILPQVPLLITLFYGAIFLVISYLFLVGFKHTNLNVGSILVSSELFFGPFFAFLLISENITSLEMLGGIFTAAAVLFSNREEN